MTANPRSALMAVGCACLASCAAGPRSEPGWEETPHAGRITLQQARDAAAAGLSSRDDLVHVLGEAPGVRFESGYEVLVYRIVPDRHVFESALPKGADRDPGAGNDAGAGGRNRSNAEFVVLVAPSGQVAKTRIRLPGDRE